MNPNPNLSPPNGPTPLVRLNRVIGSAARAMVAVKIERQDPAGSVTCRIAEATIGQAERAALLGPGREIMEPTSANTGIALACLV